MNILLIRPQYDAHHRPAGFPIGLGYLASVLENAGHYVSALDLVLYQDWESVLDNTLTDSEFGLAGITCMGVQFGGACRTGRLLKRLAPQLPIVFGGAHPSITPDDTLQHDFVDFIIRGEGEMPLLDFVTALEGKKDFTSVPSLSYRKNNQVVHNPSLESCLDLDELPFPAYHLFPIERYFEMEIPGFPSRNPNPMQIFTSRGCPYRCIYCHNLFGKRFRPRSPENVVREMRLLYDRYGVREFLIYDDNFTMDIPRAREICRQIIKSNMKIGLQFPNGIRADRVDEDLLKDMIEAGAHLITIGIESGSPRIQKLIKKGLRLENVEHFLKMTRRYDIVTNGSFIIGFPGETVKDVWKTIRFARRLELDHAFFGFATPYPSTELQQMALDQGLRMHLVDDAMDVTTPHIETKEISIRLQRILFLLCYFLFYTRPRRLWRVVRSLFQPGMPGKYLAGFLKYIVPSLRRRG